MLVGPHRRKRFHRRSQPDFLNKNDYLHNAIDFDTIQFIIKGPNIMHIKKTIDIFSIIRLQIIVLGMLLIQGCALPSWTSERFDQPEQALDPKQRLQVYDKKITKMLTVGRCVMNSKRSVARLVEEDAEIQLRDFPGYYRKLDERQQALIADRQRIREVIDYTTPNKNNLLVPYSHLSPFATIWYDTITPSDWRRIDKRYADYITFLDDMTEHTRANYARMLVQEPATDRSALLKPLFCTTAIAELVVGIKLDYPKFFDQEQRQPTMFGKISDSPEWLQKVSGIVPRMANLVVSTVAPKHVALANHIGAYRAECACYSQAQSHYKAAGARFYRQNQRYGEPLCSAVETPQMAQLDTDLRRFVSQKNSLQRDASDFLGRFSYPENDPLDGDDGKAILGLMTDNSRSLFNVARAQFGSSQRNRSESSLNHAREALVCLYDAQARASGELYLSADYIDETPENALEMVLD